MRNFLNKTVEEIKPSGIRKFFDIASEIEGAISLGVGEPDFKTPWTVREQGIYALEHSKTHYTSNAGLLELREEIAKKIKNNNNLSYDPKSEIIVTVGGSEAIDIALRAMLEEGDEVIIPTPCYVSYEPCVKLSNGKVVTISLKAENSFKLKASELKNVITSKSKIIVLNYPNNPTGAIMDYADLLEISKVIIENDLFVISDEIYSTLSYNEKHISIASLPDMKERCLVINGFSKAYSMTGWRLGYALGPKEIIKQMLKIHQYTIMCAPTNSQIAGIEALRNCDTDIAQMKESYNERRRYLLARLKDMDLPCFTPEGAFYLFPSIKKYGLSSEDFCLKLLNEEKVVVVPGNAFGDSGEGYIRISYAYSLAALKIALDRIEIFLKKLNNKQFNK